MRHNDYVKIFNKHYSDARIWKQSKHRKIGERSALSGCSWRTGYTCSPPDSFQLHHTVNVCLLHRTYIIQYIQYVHTSYNKHLFIGWLAWTTNVWSKVLQARLGSVPPTEDPGLSGCPEKRGGRASPQHLTLQPEGPDPHSHLLTTIITRALHPSFRKRDPLCTRRRGTKCKQASPCSPSFLLSS